MHFSQHEKYKLTHTKNLGNVQFSNYLKSYPSTAQLIYSLQKLLLPFDVFYFNSILILNKGLQLEVVEENLSKEIKQLTDKCSFIHKIINSIESRLKCIQKIKRGLQKVQGVLMWFKKAYFKQSIKDNIYLQYVEVQGYSPVTLNDTVQGAIKTINNFFTDLVRLRQITLYIIEEIHQWKMKVQQWGDKCGQHYPVNFIYEGQNYYKRLVSDVSFIWKSKLSQYIMIQDLSDPLIIRNVAKIQHKQQKEVLQKYFLEILLPKQQQSIDRIIRCLQMLVFNYKPQIKNIYQEQQMLIENYLNLQQKNMDERLPQEQQIIQQKIPKKLTKGEINARGWVLGRNVLKPTREKIHQIFDRHKKIIQCNIKPFKIINYAEKKSITYASETFQKLKPYQQSYYNQLRKSKSTNIRYALQNNKPTRHLSQKKQIQKKQNKSKDKDKDKYKTTRINIQKNIHQNNNSKMFRSLTKINPIIQDPNQSQNETPRNKNFNNLINKSQNKSPVISQISTFLRKKQDQNPEILVEKQQTPINSKLFLEIFRADTQRRTYKYQGIKKSQPKIYPIQDFLKRNAINRTTLPHLSKIALPTPYLSKKYKTFAQVNQLKK